MTNKLRLMYIFIFIITTICFIKSVLAVDYDLITDHGFDAKNSFFR